MKILKVLKEMDDGDYAYDNAQEDRYEEQQIEIADWVKKVIAAAKQDTQNITQIIRNADDASLALDNYAKSVANKIGVPNKLIKQVAMKAADGIPV